MPTFFERMRRLVAGEPVYRPGETEEGPDGPVYEYNDELRAKQQEGYAPSAAQPPQSAGGEVTKVKKQPPIVMVDRFECHEKPDHMEVNVFLRNDFDEIIWVERLLLFGKTFHIDHDLSPGEKREFMVYRGPYMRDSSYDAAEVHYRTSEGDYFSARHTVEYQKEGDYRYVPHRFRFFPPVKDI